MKKLSTLLILLLVTLNLFATDFTYEGVNYTILNESSKTCITKEGTEEESGNNVSGKLTIPQFAYDNGVAYNVVAIGKHSFASNELTSVILPQSITGIWDFAFYGCDNLLAINLPNSLKSIGMYAFENCQNLISIDIPDSVVELSGGAFIGCISLTAVRLSNSLNCISSGLFKGCSNLETIRIPDSVTIIGDNTYSWSFEDCTSLKYVEMSPNVSYISRYAFQNCPSLETIDLSQVKTIMDDAFSGCSSLQVVDLSSAVDISFGAFENCTNLKSVKFSDKLQSIYRDAFSGCSALEIIELPNQIKSLPGAFQRCANLKTVYLPTGLNSLSYTFTDCRSLTDIYCYTNTPPTADDVFNGVYLEGVTLHVLDGTKELFATVVPWNRCKIVDDGIIPVEDISLVSKAYVRRGESIQLTATLIPSNSKGEICWTSMNPDVASISETGLVTGHTIGKATITATCGNVSANCEVEVQPILVQYIGLNNEQFTIDVGGEYQLTATVSPEDADDKTIVWSSSNPEVATVSENGLIYAKSYGFTYIKAQCGYVSTRCEVMVLPKSVSLDYETIELNVDETKHLVANIFPENSTNKNIMWDSTNSEVVTVSDEGVVTAVAPGVAVITATCDEGSAFCVVTVIKPTDLLEIKLSIKLEISQSLRLSAIFSSDDTIADVVWSSSNSEIAVVSEDGIVTAKAKGVAVITATCGELSASCIFTIEEYSNITDVYVSETNEVSVYNLQGIRMNVTTREELSRLPVGYYIVNNQLELIK